MGHLFTVAAYELIPGKVMKGLVMAIEIVQPRKPLIFAPHKGTEAFLIPSVSHRSSFVALLLGNEALSGRRRA